MGKKFDWLLRKAGLQRFQEQVPALSYVDPDDYLYRQLGVSKQDLTPFVWERHEKIAYYLYLVNPLCNRIIELTKDYTVSAGIEFQATDRKIQKLLQDFWDDEINNMEMRQFLMALEIALTGEQVIVPTVNKYNGAVTIEILNNLQVAKVLQNPKNQNIPEYVVLRPLHGLTMENMEAKKLKIVGKDRNPMNDSFGRLVGEVFFFAVNKVTNATRGHSDVLSVIDWIEGYDEFLYSEMERAQAMKAHIWDVEIEGADKQAIDDFLQKVPPPRPGSIRAHNEKIKWAPLTPDLKAADATAQARLIRTHILAGAGFPETWFSEGGKTNRATAGEMASPTLRSLATRQKFFKHMVRRIFQFVIDQAKIHKAIPEDVDETFVIDIPMVERDTKDKAQVLVSMTNAMMIARENAWISDEEAKVVFQHFMGQMGIEIQRLRQQSGKPNADEVLDPERMKKPDMTEDYIWAMDRFKAMVKAGKESA